MRKMASSLNTMELVILVLIMCCVSCNGQSFILQPFIQGLIAGASGQGTPSRPSTPAELQSMSFSSLGPALASTTTRPVTAPFQPFIRITIQGSEENRGNREVIEIPSPPRQPDTSRIPFTATEGRNGNRGMVTGVQSQQKDFNTPIRIVNGPNGMSTTAAPIQATTTRPAGPVSSFVMRINESIGRIFGGIRDPNDQGRREPEQPERERPSQPQQSQDWNIWWAPNTRPRFQSDTRQCVSEGTPEGGMCKLFKDCSVLKPMADQLPIARFIKLFGGCGKDKDGAVLICCPLP